MEERPGISSTPQVRKTRSPARKRACLRIGRRNSKDSKHPTVLHWKKRPVNQEGRRNTSKTGKQSTRESRRSSFIAREGPLESSAESLKNPEWTPTTKL